MAAPISDDENWRAMKRSPGMYDSVLMGERVELLIDAEHGVATLRGPSDQGFPEMMLCVALAALAERPDERSPETTLMFRTALRSAGVALAETEEMDALPIQWVVLEGNLRLGNLREVAYGMTNKRLVVLRNELLRIADLSDARLASVEFVDCPALSRVRTSTACGCRFAGCNALEAFTRKELAAQPSDWRVHYMFSTLSGSYASFVGDYRLGLEIARDDEIDGLRATVTTQGNNTTMAEAMVQIVERNVDAVVFDGNVRAGMFATVAAVLQEDADLDIHNNDSVGVIDVSGSPIWTLDVYNCSVLGIRLRTSVVVTSCDRLSDISVVSPDTADGFLTYVAASSCPELIAVHSGHRIAVADCPVLEVLPRRPGPGAGISIGLNCPMVPLPSAAAFAQVLMWPEATRADYNRSHPEFPELPAVHTLDDLRATEDPYPLYTRPWTLPLWAQVDRRAMMTVVGAAAPPSSYEDLWLQFLPARENSYIYNEDSRTSDGGEQSEQWLPFVFFGSDESIRRHPGFEQLLAELNPALLPLRFPTSITARFLGVPPPPRHVSA